MWANFFPDHWKFQITDARRIQNFFLFRLSWPTCKDGIGFQLHSHHWNFCMLRKKFCTKTKRETKLKIVFDGQIFSECGAQIHWDRVVQNRSGTCPNFCAPSFLTQKNIPGSLFTLPLCRTNITMNQTADSMETKLFNKTHAEACTLSHQLRIMKDSTNASSLGSLLDDTGPSVPDVLAPKDWVI